MTTNNDGNSRGGNAPPSSAATAAAFQATAAKYGLNGDAVAKTLAAHGLQPQQPAGGPSGQNLTGDRSQQTGDLNAAKHPSLNDRQKIQAATTLQKYWTGSPEVLEEALARAGLERIQPDATDKRTELEKSFDASLGGVAPDAYDFNGVYVGHKIEAGDLGNVDRNFRTALSAMEVPPAIGRSLVEAMLDANARGWASLTSDVQRQTYSSEQRVLALRATNAPSWQALIATVKVAVDKLPADIAQELARGGAFESSRVLALLYGQGQRLSQREGMRQRK
ncbi:MAG TPA: hypothetical protein VGU20_01115 [Stellaceae bacterium]|nr:hypothetical protein [Stellaceae bacterium]